VNASAFCMKGTKGAVKLQSMRQEKLNAQTCKDEEVPTPIFETSDPEVATRLREAYCSALIHVKKLGAKYFVEDVEKRRKEVAIAVQTEREKLRKQNADPDKVFAKRREEHAQALTAR
jgi:hypothetical protein